MAQRPVHYHAHGSDGLRFACYARDLQAVLDGPRFLPDVFKGSDPKFHEANMRPSLPYPRRHTDLREITCRECWVEIVKFARKCGAKEA